MQIDAFFPYRLAVTAEAFSRQLVAVYQREYGLSREEWRLLFLLDDAGEIDSQQLAQRTSLDKVQVSRAASRLERKGLVTRGVLSSDRRLRRYVITDAGRALFRDALAKVEARAEQILGAMPADDLRGLSDGLAALQQAIGKAGGGSD